MKRVSKKIIFVFSGLILLNALLWTAVSQCPSGLLEVNYFDVGQGDSIFIETPARQQILIDGGPDSDVLKKLNQEMPFWDRSLDLVILTHPDQDHLSGLLPVLKRYQVDYVMWNGIESDTELYREWRKVLRQEDIQQIIAEEDQEVRFGEGSLQVIYPSRNLWGETYKRSNDVSVVTKLNYGQTDFLFSGDISKKIEKQVSTKDINSEVLKVAHHGSKTSSSEEFLKAVEPDLGVITVGKNSFGHPHLETLSSLKKYDIKVLRTDRDGDIKVLTDQNNYITSIK